MDNYSLSENIDEIADDLSEDIDKLADELNNEIRRTALPATIFIGLETLIGITGNVIVLYVFLFHYHRCNFRNFGLCLAATDLCSSLTSMPGEIITQLYWFIFLSGGLCRIKSFFNTLTLSSEVMCLFVISVDRFLKVCKPFGWQIKSRTAVVICLLIFIVSISLAMPVPFLWEIRKREHVYNGRNITVTTCDIDNQGKSKDLYFKYFLVLKSLVYLVLAVLFVLYVLIARRLFQRNQKLKLDIICAIESDNKLHNIAFKTKHDQSITERDKCNEPEDTVKDFKVDSEQSPGNNTDNSVNDSDLDCETNKLQYIYPFDIELSIDDELESHIYQNQTHISSSEIKRMTLSKRTMKRMSVGAKIKRNTIIMFVLTITLILTLVLHLTLLTFFTISHQITDISDNWKITYFFVFRLYFINHVIHPFMFGFLDPRFKQAFINVKQLQR